MPGGVVVVERRELDVHALALVVAVAVLDRVDDRLADGDAHPVQRLVVQARHPADVVADDLDEIEHVEGAVEVEADGVCRGSSATGDYRIVEPATLEPLRTAGRRLTLPVELL